MARTAWAKWKRFAHRAAEFQANALFFVLYFIAILPMRILGLGKEDAGSDHGRHAGPGWTERAPAASDLASVRRQF